jgi:hypothetical protein
MPRRDRFTAAETVFHHPGRVRARPTVVWFHSPEKQT